MGIITDSTIINKIEDAHKFVLLESDGGIRLIEVTEDYIVKVKMVHVVIVTLV